MNNIARLPPISRWKGALLFCLLLCSQSVRAITVQAEIKSGQFRWISAQSSFGGGVAPSIWDTPTGLVPVGTYVPGASELSVVNANLIGPSGSPVPLTLSLLGMEYNSPDVSSSISDNGGGRAVVTVAGSLVQVVGGGLGDKQVQLEREVTPFTHARPIFSLGDSATIMQAFESANAVPGTYVTQVTIPVVYDYIRQGVRVRHKWSLPLMLEIEYAPSVLTDVTVTSPTLGVITPHYYTLEGVKNVRGEAVFNGVATGVFTNGLRVKLKTGDTYRMEEVVPEPEPGHIPYSVTCGGCDTPELVVNGVAASSMTSIGTRVAGSNVNSIVFTISVNFTDIALSDLHTGAYRDQFSLLFEPDV
ncbi:hypothetical protein ACEUDK_19435 [Aeromonas veronii]